MECLSIEEIKTILIASSNFPFVMIYFLSCATGIGLGFLSVIIFKKYVYKPVEN